MTSCGLENSMVRADGVSLKGLRRFAFKVVRYAMLRYIGMNPMVLVERNLK